MTTQEKIIKNKLGVLELAQHLGNVSQACKVMGYSRDSFYRFKELYDQGGQMALQELTRRKPILKNRVEEHIENAIIELAIEQPALGQLRVSNELRKEGVIISPGGVRSVWLRHNLHTFRLRLKALEVKSVEEGIVLTESQLAALEKAKEEKKAHGEIETHHPGFLGSQDTYYVGNIKGQELAKPIWDGFGYWLEENAEQLNEKSAIHKAFAYTMKRYKWTCVNGN
jgi:hypothetical protein